MKKLRFCLPALFVFLIFTLPCRAQELSFRRAIELAVKNSTGTALAQADQQSARAAYLAQKNLYLPQMTLGSGVAYSNGFPLSIEGSAPSIINLNSTQYLLNFAQRDFNKAAKTQWESAENQAKKQREDVILETAVDYMQLDQLMSRIRVLQQEQQAAERAQNVTRERVQAGLDAEVELTRSQLEAARARLVIEQANGDAEVLRMRLSQLTGLPIAAIQTDTVSIPKMPAVPNGADLIQQAVENSSKVDAAEKAAEAKELQARGQEKQLLPAIDLAGQYGLLARYNNYDEFFRKFQRHNVTVGLVIRFPFLNFAQKAQADAAAAEAVKAKRQADAVKEQVANETAALQNTVRRLAAAKEVARLEFELAGSDTESVQAKVNAGSSNLRELEMARAAEQQKYSDYLNASFELEKAQLQLMHAAGEIESWALGSTP
jgi:outer membrane protein TolC